MDGNNKAVVPEATFSGSLLSVQGGMSVRSLSFGALSTEKSRYRMYLHALRVLILFMGFFGTAASIYSSERIYWNRSVSLDPSYLGESSGAFVGKLLSTLATVIMLACFVLKYYVQFLIMHLNEQVLPQARFLDTPLWRRLARDMLLCGVHCPVGVYGLLSFGNSSVVITYDYDSFMSPMLFTRVFTLLQVIMEETPGFHGPDATFVSKLLQVRFDWSFMLRRALDKYPISSAMVG